MNVRKRPVYQKFLESANVPEELLDGAVLLQVTGKKEAYIENYKSILEYTDTRIMLLGKQGKLEIAGKHLKIPFYTAEEMRITGCIEHINYL